LPYKEIGGGWGRGKERKTKNCMREEILKVAPHHRGGYVDTKDSFKTLRSLLAKGNSPTSLKKWGRGGATKRRKTPPTKKLSGYFEQANHLRIPCRRRSLIRCPNTRLDGHGKEVLKTPGGKLSNRGMRTNYRGALVKRRRRERRKGREVAGGVQKSNNQDGGK